MKTLTSILAVFLISAGFAAAQDLGGLTSTSSVRTSTSPDLTGYRAPQAPGVNPNDIKSPPNPKVVLKPQVGGIFVDGAKYGWTIISPGAPASWGNGQKYMSAPSTMADVQGECGPAAHRQSGGFKLFSIEF
jgi:hypothetical protein